MEIAGESIQLWADRALYWPGKRRLVIADLHLGKADAFRRAGIGLPRGGTSQDLARLGQLIMVTAAQELWILGDVLHGSSRDACWQDTWRGWRARHADLRIAAVLGNHDRALAGAGLGIALLGEAVDEPPFAFRHMPQAHASLHVMCGHLHPRIALPGLRGRWPVFWLRAGQCVLPAFSAFTGSMPIVPEQGDLLAVCAGDRIMCLRA